MEPVKLNNGRCILLNGDCLQEMRRIKPNSIDMVFADLPYGTTKNKWDTPIDLVLFWEHIRQIRKYTAPTICTANGVFAYILGNSNIDELLYDRIWDKVSKTNHLNAKKQPLRQHEKILVFGKTQPTYNPQKTRGKLRTFRNGSNTGSYGDFDSIETTSDEYYPTDILVLPRGNTRGKNLHDTEKPLALLYDIIKTYTNEGDTVLDPTMGSGTTGVACINLNRRFIGIEKDENYFNIATKRINEAIKQLQKAAA